MREKLNSNPLAQMAVIGVLLVAVGIFLLGSMGGGEEESAEPSAPSSSEVAPGVIAEGAAPTPSGLASALALVNQASAGATPPLPRPIVAAFESNKTVVLLFVHDGGIDDDLVRVASLRLAALPNVSTFIVAASKISRYAAVTEGVGIDRVPALVVIAPKHLNQATPTASVSYGFQSGDSIVQAVIDAGYKGPTVDYHP